MLAILMLAACAASPAADAPNLVPNPTFDQPDPADPARPAGWELPDGLGIQWLDAPKGHGKAIRMDTRISETDMEAQWKLKKLDGEWHIPNAAKNPIAETYGLSLYSKPFPIKRGRPYRVTYDYLGAAGGVKVWVRGYVATTDAEGKPTMRRIYEAVANGDQHRGGKDEEWHTTSMCFHPTIEREATKNLPKVTEMRVMLFAFHPPQVYWFDNPVVAEISDEEYAKYKDWEKQQRDMGGQKKARK